MKSEYPEIQGYKIIEKIAVGGMSEIYLARQESLNREVIIKKVNQHVSKEEISRFKKEGEILARLNHNNIVRVYDLIENASGIYIIEEYIQGVSLRVIINQLITEYKQIDLNDFSKISSQLIKALQAAHSEGIIHRDIKPENIIVTENKTVKLCDFGISALIDNMGTLTSSNLMGTIEYMAPELFNDPPQIVQEGDYYSLGCVLLELLSLNRPYGVTSTTNIMSVIKKKITSSPDFGDNYPEWFTEYTIDFLKLIENDLSDRIKGLEKVVSIINALIIKEESFNSLNTVGDILTRTIIKPNFKKFIEADSEIRNKKISKNNKFVHWLLCKNQSVENVKSSLPNRIYNDIKRTIFVTLKIAGLLFLVFIFGGMMYSITTNVSNYLNTRITKENIVGKWRVYEIKYNGISKNHYYSIFWILEFKKNNAGSFLHDENNNNKFEEDEKDRFSYSVRDNFVYMKFEGQEEKKVKFEIILKNNSSYPADKGFTFHTKALIEKRIDEYSNETIYEFWEYEPK